MSAVYEVPLKPSPQTITVPFSTGYYQLRTLFCPAANGEGGWIMDIRDALGNALVLGIPLVTGANLLEQYAYAGIGGTLYCVTDGNLTAPPTYSNLGVTAHLYYQV